MDSMRSLNTSLPSTSSPKKPVLRPSEDLLQAFKTAALSVTNLYKTAASDQSRAHAEGYQDALADLLDFLDKDNLGLSDGEGWRVRQWATERLDGPRQPHPGSDSDEDAQEDKRARSSSPVIHRKPSRDSLRPHHSARSISPARAESAPLAPTEPLRPLQEVETTPPRSDFTFTSSLAYPEVEMGSTEEGNPGSVRLDVLGRHNRSSARHAHNSRANSRSAPLPLAQLGQLGQLGGGAGFKRRAPYMDFFDISGFGNGRDGFGGGKRGRFT